MIGQDGFPIRISDAEAYEANVHHIHPITGEVDHAIGDKLLTYLAPSSAISEKALRA